MGCMPLFEVSLGGLELYGVLLWFVTMGFQHFSCIVGGFCNGFSNLGYF